MLGATYSVHAQSSIDQKQKKELERIKKRRQELIMKAQEQQKQSNEERRGPLVNSNQQTINRTTVPNQQQTQETPQAGEIRLKQNNNKQPALNVSQKKEDINQ
jgi:hypothetical protein